MFLLNKRYSTEGLLAPEIHFNIISFLDTKSKAQISKVSKNYYEMSFSVNNVRKKTIFNSKKNKDDMLKQTKIALNSVYSFKSIIPKLQNVPSAEKRIETYLNNFKILEPQVKKVFIIFNFFLIFFYRIRWKICYILEMNFQIQFYFICQDIHQKFKKI